MEILKEKYTITELSDILKITDHALRFYEKEFGLIIPKDERGRRYYTTEMANLLYKIKVMRSEGLEIKAIKKILQDECMFQQTSELPGVNSTAIMQSPDKEYDIIKKIFSDFGQQITSEISSELTTAREHLSKEIAKSKLELGACVENGMRKLENRMEKHFQDVDRALGKWREKSKRNFFQKLFSKKSRLIQ